MSKTFYTPPEIAEMLEVSDATVRHWVRQGYIEGIKTGNPAKPRIRIRKEIVNDLRKQYGLEQLA